MATGNHPFSTEEEGSDVANLAATSATCPHVDQVVTKTAAQNAIWDKAISDSEAVLRHHARAEAPVQRGFLAETHHEATFNANAIGKGLRAELVSGQQAADIRIVTAEGATVSEAQVKMMSNPAACKTALSDPRYDGMQKVGPAGAEYAQRGIASHIEAGGVSSDPLTLEAADRMTANPAAHYEALRPSLAAEAARAGIVGAGMGAALGAAVATVNRIAQKKGRLDKADAKVIGESAAVGAASASIGNMLGILAQSTFVGGLATGMVGTAYAVSKCPDRASAVQEVVVGTTGVLASIAAVTACSTVGILSGPMAPVVTPVVGLVVGWQANVQARKVAQSVTVQQNVRWGAGAAAQKAKQAATLAAQAGKSAAVSGAALATQAAVASGQAAMLTASSVYRRVGGAVDWCRRPSTAPKDTGGDDGVAGCETTGRVG